MRTLPTQHLDAPHAGPTSEDVDGDDGDPVPRDHLKAAHDALARRAIGPVAVGATALYAVFTFTHVLVLPPDVGPLMSTLAAASALFFSGLWLWDRHGGARPGMGHAVGIVALGVALVNCAALLVLLDDPKQTTNFIIVELALAFFFLSTPWFLRATVLTVATWGACVLYLPPSAEWVHYGFAMFSSTVLAGVMHAVRRRSFGRLEGLRLRDRRGREALADANAALSRSEETFRRLSDAAFEGIVIHDNGRILEANRAFGDLVGCDAATLPGRQLTEFATPQTLDALPRDEDLATGVPFEVPLRRVDGTVLSVEVAVRNLPFRGMDARVVAVRDVTARRAAEDEMETLRHQVESAGRLAALGAMASGVAHEVNNPLAYIITNEELALDDLERLDREESLTDEGHRVLAETAEAVRMNLQGLHHIKTIVKGLGQISRPSEAARRVVDLTDTARDVVAFARAHARKVGAHLEVAVSPVTPVRATRGEVSQVLLNLVINGLDAAGPGGTVRLSAEVAPQDVLFHVEDTGPGIPEDVAREVFDPFFTTKEHGTGLGLHISRSIAKDHGGDLTFTNLPDGGTRFTLRLPRPNADDLAGADATATDAA